jgi:hypothetical protein
VRKNSIKTDTFTTLELVRTLRHGETHTPVVSFVYNTHRSTVLRDTTILLMLLEINQGSGAQAMMTIARTNNTLLILIY